MHPVAGPAWRAADQEWLRVHRVTRIIALTASPLTSSSDDVVNLHLPPPEHPGLEATEVRLAQCCELAAAASGRVAFLCARGPDLGGVSGAALVAWHLLRSGLSLSNALSSAGAKPKPGALAALLSLEWRQRGCCSDLGALDAAWSVLRWDSTGAEDGRPGATVHDGRPAPRESYTVVVQRGHRMRISSLSRDPQMARVEGFVSPAEAAHLIRIAAPELHPSRVARADVEIGGEGAAPAADTNCDTTASLLSLQTLSVPTSVSTFAPTSIPAAAAAAAPAFRTSWSCALGRSDIVLSRLVDRAALLCGLSPHHAEEAQVVRYRQGEEYKEHCDYFSLQADSGGETCFPRLGQSHRLRPGDALIWMNIESHRGWLDRRTLHAGRPVAGAEPKWGLNIWLRQRPLRPSAEDSAMEGGGSAGGSAAAVVGQDPRSSAPAGTPAIPAVGGAVVRGMASAPAAGGPAGVEPWKPGWTPPRQTAASALAQVSLERRERE